MRCDRCLREAVIYQEYSGLWFCGDHLLHDIEVKAKRAIRTHGWLAPDDRIAVALSGGYASAAVLTFLRDLIGNRRDITLSAFVVTGIPGADAREERAARVAGACGVPLARTSWHGTPSGMEDRLPCTCCTAALLRRIGRFAAGHGITKVALGTTLDDRAGEVLCHIFSGAITRLTGDQDRRTWPVRLIHPFLYIPAREAALYAAMRFPGMAFPPEGEPEGKFAADARALLSDYTGRHPSTRYSLARLADALSGLAPAPARKEYPPVLCPATGTDCIADRGVESSGE
jgi:tRNA(Ile)-lysidine synthase TilS/MesJ